MHEIFSTSLSYRKKKKKKKKKKHFFFIFLFASLNELPKSESFYLYYISVIGLSYSMHVSNFNWFRPVDLEYCEYADKHENDSINDPCLLSGTLKRRKKKRKK